MAASMEGASPSYPLTLTAARSSGGQVLSGQPKLRAGWRGAIKYPRWPQGRGRQAGGGLRAVSISSRNLKGCCAFTPNTARLTQIQQGPALGQRLSA